MYQASGNREGSSCLSTPSPARRFRSEKIHTRSAQSMVLRNSWRFDMYCNRPRSWFRRGSGPQELRVRDRLSLLGSLPLIHFGLLRSQKASSNATSGNSTSINPEYLSKTGAFNGTGIALASYSFSGGGYGDINLYFQHHTGQIRSAQLTNAGTWSGGSYAEVVAVDAKNATPIAAVAYAMNNVATVSCQSQFLNGHD